jgi:FlaA1/EpsC-like NDP-sugar epimerase
MNLLPIKRNKKTPFQITLTIDLLLFVTGFFCAVMLRFDFDFTVVKDRLFTFGSSYQNTYLFPLLFLTVSRIVLFNIFSVYKSFSRYFTFEDALKIVKSQFITSILLAIGLWLFKLHAFPRSIVFIEFFLTTTLLLGIRASARLVNEHLVKKLNFQTRRDRDVIVIGGGISGQLIIKSIISNSAIAINPVAVLDDNLNIQGKYIHGIKVRGTLADLKKVLTENNHISAVILAIPNLSSLKIDEIKAVCSDLHVPLKLLQSFEELAVQDFEEHTPKITIEEVLHREVQITNNVVVRKQIENKVVLVTGAGGSIGSELVRQVLHFNPKTLILLEQSEFNLYSIEQEIKNSYPQVQKIYFLANICNKDRIEKAFTSYRPAMVFHAAAYKHVPLLEENCYEAFMNNVIGTRNLLEHSYTYGVEKFVLISTDKAVDPSSVMGCTKRIAELMVKESAHTNHFINARSLTMGIMNTGVVRFGNVINSSGSVIPLFKKQILDGKPLTVTHPEMERYFMSIREAVKLVLSAGTLGDKGEIYLLDMGKPIKIVDVAKKLQTLYGRRDLPIIFSGLRPGEKLTEQLFSEYEDRFQSALEKVFVVRSKNEKQVVDIFSVVNEIEKYIHLLENTQIASLLHKIVSGEYSMHTHHLIASLNGTLNSESIQKMAS